MSPLARSGRSVVIAGAGHGLGREIALGLAAHGYLVFGTAASGREVEEVRGASRGRASLVVCDTDMKEAVTAWADGVSDAVGNAGLDILIINPGAAASGPMEFLSLDVIRRAFDLNLFGALAIINAFLPALRTARGRIVQISSWMATLPLPCRGPLQASQAAMEVFAAVYRAELKPLGVDVVAISHDPLTTDAEMVATNLARDLAAMTSEQRRLYARTIGAVASDPGWQPTEEIDPSAIAAKVIALVEQRPAPVRAAIGRRSEQQLRILRAASGAEPDAAGDGPTRPG